MCVHAEKMLKKMLMVILMTITFTKGTISGTNFVINHHNQN